MERFNFEKLFKDAHRFFEVTNKEINFPPRITHKERQRTVLRVLRKKGGSKNE